MPTTPGAPVLPAYGRASLGEVMPSLLAALGGGGPNPLDVPAAGAIVLFVVDGLGWELLRAHAEEAPFLAAHLDGARPLTSGYPSSTATSLAMLSTACPPIAHGLTGYTMAAPGLGRAMNTLAWTTHGLDPYDLRQALPPESLQPLPTMVAHASSAGVRMTAIGPEAHAGSGLTRAILRDGPYRGVSDLDRPDGLDAVRVGLQGDGPRAVYAYHPALDAAGHRHGPGSAEWRSALRRVDAMAQRLAALLPRDGLLAATADHGMVDLGGAGAERIELSERPDLAAGVRFLAGEARARHVHAQAGQAAAMLARWRDALGDRAWVMGREEVIEAGWLGPPAALREAVRERIGDVVCAAAGPLGVFQRLVDPGEASLAGHHGSLTSTEVYVPWLLVPAGG